jgi:predicted CXXCH cytochrome family protein
MLPAAPPPAGTNGRRTNILLASLGATFAALTLIFVADLWGKPPTWKKIPLVDPTFLETTPWRQSYSDLVAAKEDLSDFDCYACHDKKKPGQIRFDEKHKILIPQEHSNISMGHGSHDRNNLCFNCHNETNLLTLQVRDGRELKFNNSTPLCGSCHGPTYGDWEAGAHGRTSGYWDKSQGAAIRLACVNCHDPHTPKIPKLLAAPGPHTLHEDDGSPIATGTVKPITPH